MATEIMLLEVTHTPNINELECFFDDVVPLPRGLRTAVLRKSASDSRIIVGFITWATIENRILFSQSAQSSKVSASLSRLSNWPSHTSFHVFFEQGLPHPVFRCPVAELIILRRRIDIRQEDLRYSLIKYLKAASKHGLKHHYYGFQYEDPEYFVILLGWNSKEAQKSATSLTALNELWKEMNRFTVDDNKAARHVIFLGRLGAFQELLLDVKKRYKI